jgi:hypothetical protein
VTGKIASKRYYRIISLFIKRWRRTEMYFKVLLINYQFVKFFVMKKISNVLIVFVFFFSIAFILNSCEEKPMIKKDSNINTEFREYSSAPRGGSSDCCEDDYTLLDEQNDEWCCNDGSNCLPCVTVTPPSVLISNFEVAIQNGSVGVKEYFTGNEYLQLFPALENDSYNMLTRLQSGDYQIEKEYDPSNSNHIIYKAYNLAGDYFGLPIWLTE